jgi:hypothetical protein
MREAILRLWKKVSKYFNPIASETDGHTKINISERFCRIHNSRPLTLRLSSKSDPIVYPIRILWHKSRGAIYSFTTDCFSLRMVFNVDFNTIIYIHGFLTCKCEVVIVRVFFFSASQNTSLRSTDHTQTNMIRCHLIGTRLILNKKPEYKL